MRLIQFASNCIYFCSIFMFFSFRSVPCSLRDAVKIISLVTVVGAWVGAFPIPLDWDRDWQVDHMFYLVLQLQLLCVFFSVTYHFHLMFLRIVFETLDGCSCQRCPNLLLEKCTSYELFCKSVQLEQRLRNWALSLALPFWSTQVLVFGNRVKCFKRF